MPVVTRALILINVLVFFFELALPKQGVEQLFYLFGIVPARFTDPDWASYAGFPVGRLLDNPHAPISCMAAGSTSLPTCGRSGFSATTSKTEWVRFALQFSISYAAASPALTQVLTNPDSTLPSVGASGAIAGVLGAYLMFFPTARLIVMFPIFFFPFFFEVPAVFYLALWFFTQSI